ncbi:MAG: DUF721 domain-containing protein [Pseudomonadota bacterium]
MATRAQRRAPPSLGKYSSRIVRSLAQSTRYTNPDFADQWSAMVGPELAALCRPGRLTGAPGNQQQAGKSGGRTLEVIVQNGAAATRISLHEAEIIAAANRALGPGQVTRLAIRQNAGGQGTRTHSNGNGKKDSGPATLAGVLDRFKRS